MPLTQTGISYPDKENPNFLDSKLKELGKEKES
jgi:hypothetical protein